MGKQMPKIGDPHPSTLLKQVVCQLHGGLGEATEEQIKTVYESMGPDAQARVRELMSKQIGGD